MIDTNGWLEEQVYQQLKKFRRSAAGHDYNSWYRIQSAMARARDMEIRHDKIENFIMPNLFDEKGDPIYWYHYADPQQKQVNMVKRNLAKASVWSRKRGRVTEKKLKHIMMDILHYRINEYENPTEMKEKLKILCIVGESGAGKTLASLHLKYHKDANVICSFTTRPPRSTEVEGRDHHFIDIVPDTTDLIASANFGGHLYYACRWQVSGPCTVYVVDEKGLDRLRADHSDEYDIYTVLIRRSKAERKRVGVDVRRMRRDNNRILNDGDFDWVIDNNGTKAELFKSIEEIYETVKNK